MAGLGCRDGGGSSQDARVSDEVRSTQISANANMLYYPCGRDHGLYISEDGRKVECATRGRCRAERSEERLKPQELFKDDEDGRIKTNTYLESGDMSTLVDLDGCDLLDGAIPR